MRGFVYHAGALGDFITTLPAIALLRQRFSGTAVCYFGKKDHGNLGVAFGYFEEVWDIDNARWAVLFSPDPPPDALGCLSCFDWAAIFADCSSPIVVNACRAGIPIIMSQPPFPAERIHVVDYHCAMIDDRFSSSSDSSMEPRLTSLKTVKPAVHICRPTAVIHTGSGSTLKNWPIDRFFALAHALRSQQVQIVWLLGPAERFFPVVDGDIIVQSAPLEQVAALFAHCSVYIGNDSGISHLAAAVGCSTIALFGPSDATVWAPRGPRVRIISGPCPRGRHCHGTSTAEPCPSRDCLMSVGVAEVVAAAQSMIAPAATERK